MLALKVFLGIIAVIASALLLACIFDLVWLRLRTRGRREVAPGDAFELTAGLRLRVGELQIRPGEFRKAQGAIEDEPGVLCELPFCGARSLPLRDLPALVGEPPYMYEVVLVAPGPPPSIRVMPWRGIRLVAPEPEIAWADGTARAAAERKPGEDAPGAPPQSCPKVPVEGTYAFDAWALREHGTQAWGAARHIGIIIRDESGGTVRNDLQGLQRAAFTRRTGVHPSYAPDPTPPPSPPGAEPPVTGGKFVTDLGPVLAAPAKAVAYTIVAVFGPYRSNEVRVRLTP